MDTIANILALADRCVKCGLCLPQCPTYELTANENESPRGRISLVQGWLGGQLTPSKILTNHLDQCLLCRRCERVCPSLVPYGEIMDQTKQLLVNEPAKINGSLLKKWFGQVILDLFKNKHFVPTTIKTLRLMQTTGLIYLAQKSGSLKLLGLQRLSSFLPHLEKSLKLEKYYPALTEQVQGEIALFTGCLAKQLDFKTVMASIRLLNRLGYAVHVPQQQVCCGALHLHAGNKKQAVNFAKSNVQTFNQMENITTIISLVNGCTSQLSEYAQLGLKQDFIPKVKDIIEFLAELNWPENTEFKRLNISQGKSVSLHIPCSLQNILRAENKLVTLLKKIPGMNLPPESINSRCCGAAGSYFLRQPFLADKLQAQVLNKLTKSTPELIISSNLGCSLQLKAGLTQLNKNIDVIHPVILIEQHLKYSPDI